MALGGGNQVNEVLVEILHISIGLAADMWIATGRWYSSEHITPIKPNCWVDGANDLIHMLGKLLPCCAVGLC